MKLEALDHPKTLDFASRLGVETPTAIGHLELLWAFTGKKAPQGNIGKWADGAIARACMWNGDPEHFMSSLVVSGYVDEDDKYRYLIHDWPEHAPRWVKSKLKTLGLAFISSAEPMEGAEGEEVHLPAQKEDASGDAVNDVSQDTSTKVSIDTKRSEVKGSQVKETELPTWMDRETWVAWESFRKEMRKPLTPRAREAQIEFLEENKFDHVEIIRQSIRCSWVGLFALKNRGSNAAHQRIDNSAPARVERAIAAKRQQNAIDVESERVD